MKTQSMTRIFIGDANWDLYLDANETVWAIPKPECAGAKSSYFGNKQYLLRLMQQGISQGEVTEAGLEFLQGLHHKFMPGWNWLTFHRD